MGISSAGVGSGLDVGAIIDKLMAAEASRPRAALAKKEGAYQAKLSAFGNLSGTLGSFQNALSMLNTQSTFQSMNATSSDGTIITASATAKATAGTYSINVTQLSQAQTLSSAGAGQNSTTATIGTGAATTVTFQFGTTSGAVFTQDPNHASGMVTIDSTNNSLQGIRDAINKANLGVTASIVSDGSTTPYHLVVKSNTTGATSSMKISVAGDAAVSGLLAYDPGGVKNMTETSAAQNALLSVNGIPISSQTDSVSSAIDGVSLKLSKAGTSNLTIARNTGSVESGVNALVKAYNDVNATIKKLTAYDATTKQAGPLIGDSSVRNIESQIRKMLSSPLTGSSGNLTTLSQAGISIDKSGMMSVDSSKLSAAMSTSMNDVTALFSSIGTTTDSLVSYVSSTSATTPGSNAVYVSSLATQGKLVGNAAIGTTITAGVNDSLLATVNGVSATIPLIPGSYTAAQLAAQVQSTINGASAFSSAGIAVTATLDGANNLTITSNTYGSASKVIIGGNGASNLLGAAPVTTNGTDVVGTIGGVAAGGSGQFLTGASSSTAAGLKLEITGGAVGVARGTVTFSQGYAFHLNNLIDNFIGSSGMISGRTQGLSSSIKDVGKQREALERQLAATQKRYTAQFTALDVTISKMNATSSYLTQQLAALKAQTGQ
jgi:flagellar hook-associated protein 2